MKTYKLLLNNIAVDNIKNMASGTVFALRDVLPNPQALWGRFFYNDVTAGTIANVVPVGTKDSVNASLYKRV